MATESYKLCKTRLCKGVIITVRDWKKDKFCEYIEAICPICQMNYWIIKRAKHYDLYDNVGGKLFDNRKKAR